MYARMRINFIALMKKRERAARVYRVNINWSVDIRCVVNRGQLSIFLRCFHYPFRIISSKIYSAQCL